MFLLQFGLDLSMKSLSPFLILTPFVFGCFTAQAQSTQRFAFSSGWGSNFAWTATSQSPSISWNNRLSFTPHYAVMIDLELESGTLGGEGIALEDNVVINQKFNSSYTYKGAVLNINLKKLFAGRQKPNNVIPYLYAGIGYLDFETVKYINGGTIPVKRYKYNVYSNRVGVKFRFRINDYLDWLAVAETTLPQTYYLDANPDNRSFDKFSSVRFELCYKIGGSRKNEYIEWQARRCKLPCAGRFY